MVTTKGGDFGTSLVHTGSFNLNTANLTGMISLVKPALCNQHMRGGGAFYGKYYPGNAVNRVTVTFLPEPGVASLLGVGAFGLVGLSRLKRR